jgi:hypothetical protein
MGTRLLYEWKSLKKHCRIATLSVAIATLNVINCCCIGVVALSNNNNIANETLNETIVTLGGIVTLSVSTVTICNIKRCNYIS